mmetsp:Transcript_17265/g.42168  ORF Transcript_17265/g.42168 Transcript_17265/m.42168 type:complete len:294 (+) Transcript_17265:40-921(+)
MEHFMSLSALIFLPTMWLRNLAILSYFSALGLVSSICLIIGLTIDGFLVEPDPNTCVQPECTGSILDPSPTVMYKLDNLGVLIGIVMVGFAGHAVFPTLRNDMRDKKDYNRMVDITYALVCTAYAGMACVGYAMFGEACLNQVTLNLGKNVISQVTVWIVVANPITKFALDMAPIALGVESFFQVAFHIPATGWFSILVSMVLRTLLTCMALATVVAVPDFALMMGLLGSICSFTISVVFPCACYLKIFWKSISPLEKAVNTFLVVFGLCCAATGTYCALMGAAPDALGIAWG